MSKSAGKSNKKLSGEVTRRTPEVDRKKGDIKKAGGIKKTAEMVPWEWSHTVAFWGLAVLLFFSNYFKALYFPAQQERALIFAAIVFWFAWLWQWSQKDNGFLNSPLDYFALAFPAVYLISAFQAANYGLAVDEAVKATLCFMVYWAASRLVRNERDIVTVLNVIYMSAIGVALAGLAAATNIIHINRGFLDGRLCSVFQYPNTLASYLLAVALIGLYLWRRAAAVETSKHIIQYLYAAANFLILAVFIGTKSQGGFLVFLFVFILFFIVIPKVDRAPVFIHFVTCCLFSALTMWGFLHAVAGGKTGLAWLWILLGLICAPAAHLLYNFGASKGPSRWIAGHKNTVLAAFLLFVVICLAGAAVYAAGHGDMVRAGIEKIRLRNAAERMYFYHDALKMFRERPILGWGGGGWDEAYRAYQSYFYNSDKVHGYYFQVLVETGIVGLLALLAVWAGFLHLTHRLYHQAKTNYAGRFLISVITVSAVSLGLHAAIDFDLSLSALALVLWTMFGLARGAGIYSGAGAAEKKSGKHVAPRYVAPAGVLAALILVIACAASLALAGNYSARVGTRVQSQNVNQSIELLKKASAYNPFAADYHSNLARLYQYQGNSAAAVAQARRATELSKYSAVRYTELASLIHNGEDGGAQAVAYAEKALSLDPFQIERYEFLAATCFNAGYNNLLAGNRDMAKQYFEQAAGVPDRIEDIAATLNDTEKELWKDSPMINPTAPVKLNAGKSLCLLGRWPEAEQNLQAALAGEKVKGEAVLWLAVLRDKQGRTQEAQNLLAEAGKLAPESAKKFEELSGAGILTN